MLKFKGGYGLPGHHIHENKNTIEMMYFFLQDGKSSRKVLHPTTIVTATRWAPSSCKWGYSPYNGGNRGSCFTPYL